MSTSKVDAAVTADWSWVNDPLIESAVRRAAERGRVLFGGSFDDLYQDCALWLAVRPEVVAHYRETYTDPSELHGLLASRIYTKAVKGREIAAQKRRAVCYDELLHAYYEGM